jgi:transcriptional regulator with XRE-family HTH domain
VSAELGSILSPQFLLRKKLSSTAPPEQSRLLNEQVWQIVNSISEGSEFLYSRKKLADARVCSKHYTMPHPITFGQFLRDCRVAKSDTAPEFSLRKVAERVGIEPSYLSKIERDEQPPPGETVIRKLALELAEDPDVLLALAGKVSSDLLAIIRSRPRLFADLIRQLKNLPDHAVLRLVREVRDGNW